MTGTTKLTIAVAVAMLIATLPAQVLYNDPNWVPLAVVQTALLALVGVLLRSIGTPPPLVQLIQVTALAGWLAILGTRWSTLQDGGILERLHALILDGLKHVRSSASPVGADPGVLWMTLAVFGIFYLIADMLTVPLEQPAWTIAPLTMPMLIPTLSGLAPIPQWQGAAVLVAYGLILLTKSATEARAASGVLGDNAPGHPGLGRYRMGMLIGIPVILVAWLISSSVPTGSGGWPHEQNEDQPLEVSDPSIDLSESLNKPVTSSVLSYRSSSDKGSYLRLISLPVLTESGAKLDNLNIQQNGTPTPPKSSNSKTVTLNVTMESFDSEYLPAPYSPTAWDASGKWGWDSATQSIVSLENESTRRRATRKLRYSVTSLVPDPSSEQIAAASAGHPEDTVTTMVPEQISPKIRTLSNEVTRKAKTDGEKAIAIESFFRSGKFRYSTTAPSGAGPDLIDNFLLRENEGFCIHFATSMALMARIEGIPSRVAVGFLPGKKALDGSWKVTSKEMHAWPELYFEELGWVAFEPTVGVASSLNHDLRSTTATSSPSGGSTPSPSGGSTSSQSGDSTPTQSPEQPAPQPTPSITTSTETFQPPTGDQTFLWRILLPILAAGVAVIGLILAPHIIRTDLRRRHLSPALPPSQRAIAAWAEVRAVWEDLGEQWPGGSPRSAAAALAHAAGDARKELNQLALAAERSLFARAYPDPGDLSAQVSAVQQAFRAGRPTKTIVRAYFLPRSLKASKPSRLDTSKI